MTQKGSKKAHLLLQNLSWMEQKIFAANYAISFLINSIYLNLFLFFRGKGTVFGHFFSAVSRLYFHLDANSAFPREAEDTSRILSISSFDLFSQQGETTIAHRSCPRSVCTGCENTSRTRWQTIFAAYRSHLLLFFLLLPHSLRGRRSCRVGHVSDGRSREVKRCGRE